MKAQNKKRAVTYIRVAASDTVSTSRLEQLNEGSKQIVQDNDLQVARTFSDFGKDLKELDKLIAFVANEANEIDVVITAEAETVGRSVNDLFASRDLPRTCRMELRIFRSYEIVRADGTVELRRMPKFVTAIVCETHDLHEHE